MLQIIIIIIIIVIVVVIVVVISLWEELITKHRFWLR
jgi:hypothetical protein